MEALTRSTYEEENDGPNRCYCHEIPSLIDDPVICSYCENLTQEEADAQWILDEHLDDYPERN